MGKIILRLTESELRQMVIEAVNGVLQQQNTPANSIARLIYDTTGINVNESRVTNSLLEGKTVHFSNGMAIITDDDGTREEIPQSKYYKQLAAKNAANKKDGEPKENNKLKKNKEVKKAYKRNLLKNILIDSYDGMRPEEIAKKYNIPEDRVRVLIKAGLKKFNGDDTFNIKPSAKIDKSKLAKPNKDFRERVFDVAKERIPDEDRKKLFPTDDKWRTSDEKIFRDDNLVPVGDVGVMNKVQPETGYINTPEFKNSINSLLTKYLDGNTTLAEMLLDYYSCGNFAEVARKYNMYKQRTTAWITKAVETLRNSAGFKREVSDLLNGKYDEEKVKSGDEK